MSRHANCENCDKAIWPSDQCEYYCASTKITLEICADCYKQLTKHKELTEYMNQITMVIEGVPNGPYLLEISNKTKKEA